MKFHPDSVNVCRACSRSPSAWAAWKFSFGAISGQPLLYYWDFGFVYTTAGWARARSWMRGYLIYRLYPHLKVVVDDRHDLYGEEFLKDYLKTVRVEPGWDKLLNENHVNWILIPVGSPLSSILKGKPAWKIVHEDEVAILFYRAGES